MKTRHILLIKNDCAVLASRDLLARTIQELPPDAAITDIAKTPSGWSLDFTSELLGEETASHCVQLEMTPKIVRSRNYK